MTLCKHRVVRAHRSLLSVLSVTIAADVFFACPLLPKHHSPLHATFSYSLLCLLLYPSLCYSLLCLLLYPSLSYSVLCLLLYPSLCQLLNALLPRETFIKIYIISPNILNMRFLRQKLCYTGPIYQMWQPLVGLLFKTNLYVNDFDWWSPAKLLVELRRQGMMLHDLLLNFWGGILPPPPLSLHNPHILSL